MNELLLVKLSSLGDVVHALPAVTDALKARPMLRIDWVVEEAFVPIAALHPGVRHVLPIALRRWRRKPWASRTEFADFYRQLRSHAYDSVLDAQGLVKSAVVTRMAIGERLGFDAGSAREALAAGAYSRRFAVAQGLHAIARLRQLFAAALGYALPTDAPDFGIAALAPRGDYVLFLHGTTWPNKHWPAPYWRQLYVRLHRLGIPVRICHADADEEQRARAIGDDPRALLPRLDLADLLPWLGGAAAVVSVDSGLGHLAAALGVPTLMLHGPTSAQRTGAQGQRAELLTPALACAPCMARTCTHPLATAELARGAPSPPCMAMLTPERVLPSLLGMLRAGVQHA